MQQVSNDRLTERLRNAVENQIKARAASRGIPAEEEELEQLETEEEARHIEEELDRQAMEQG